MKALYRVCPHRYLQIVFPLFLALMLMSMPASAELKQMSDSELSGVYATGFSNFSITDLGGGLSETEALFDIRTYSYITIESLKLGYHDEYDYKNPTPSFGWDEDWENIVIGQDYEDPSTDFQTEGAFFRAVFENIDDPTTRELKSIEFGATSVTGDISADFIKFSGTIDDSADNTPEYNGHGLNLGNKTITATDSEFTISLSIDGFDKGYWVTFDQATVGARQYFPPP